MTVEQTIEHVRERTFHLSVQTAKGEGRAATCFCIARLARSNRIIVATARHAVQFGATTTIDWLFRRFSEEEDCLGKLRFTTDDSVEQKRPYRFYKLSDIAFIVLPPPDYAGCHVDGCSRRHAFWPGFPIQIGRPRVEAIVRDGREPVQLG